MGPTRKYVVSFVSTCSVLACLCYLVYVITDKRTGNMNENNRCHIKQELNATKHIAFLKVSKSGSTTMQNILFRFGIKHSLNVLLPKPGEDFISRDKHEIMPIKKPMHHDILAIQTDYDKIFFRSLLPRDAVTIGIVREPTERIVSAAYYYRDVWNEEYLVQVPKQDFLKHIIYEPDIYDLDIFSMTRNEMAKQFGFSKGITPRDKVNITSYLNELNSDFLLVLVLEQFDESLVLLKRYLNWSFFDIFYMKVNTHDHQPVSLNDEEKDKLKVNAFLDFAIYEFFLNILKAKIKRAGEDFLDEVNYFKNARHRVEQFCLQFSNTPTLYFQGSYWDNCFSVSKTDCNLMKKEEYDFTEFMRSKQRHIIEGK